MVTVRNTAPSITSATGPATPVPVARPAVVTARFTDPGAGDSHTCTVDWKDGGKPAAGEVTASGCRAERIYASAGLRQPVITVTDNDGGANSTTLPDLIVYDRAVGPVVGSGTVGKAFFSLAVGYLPGASAPAGAVAFDLGSAHVKFRSAKTDWLVVSGSRGVLQGSGTVNGKSGYSFRIMATDGPDTFRIKIWKTSGGQVVHDSRAATMVRGIVTIGVRHR